MSRQMSVAHIRFTCSMQNFLKKKLTTTARHATMVLMTMSKVPILPSGDRITSARLALSQQAAAPVDKTHGGGVLA